MRYPHPGPRTHWRHADQIPRRQRGLFLARARRNQRPCMYGHLGCSDREAGPCSDQLLGMIAAEHRAADPHCACNDCLDYLDLVTLKEHTQ